MVNDDIRSKDSMLIPAPVKRQLRQEAGFGCCKCGNPIFEYHHIVPDSENVGDLMILCPICHHEATVKAMTEEEQRFLKLHPHNIERGYAQGKLKISQKWPVVVIGTNQFVGDGNLVLVDEERLLSLQVDTSGRIELSVQLYDPNDQQLALIERNEWISGDPMPWDLESSFQWLRIRNESRHIALEINSRELPIEIRADLWRKGQNFQLGPSQIKFNGIIQGFQLMNLCLVGIRLVADTESKQLRLVADPRFGEGALVSWPDPLERIAKGLEAWEKLRQRTE
jgi:hypothetical protein